MISKLEMTNEVWSKEMAIRFMDMFYSMIEEKVFKGDWDTKIINLTISADCRGVEKRVS